tara:strand:+ start:28 stop:246 length:219 start_codon:yes stop_codon:yes gene_type:complete
MKNLLNKKIDDLSFEEAYKKLTEIVELIEEGNINLDDSIEYYEVGILLKNHCEKKLKNAEIKIKKVIDNNIE